MTVQPRLMIAEELLELPISNRYELVKGDLRKMAPAGEEHGLLAHELALSLGQHVKANKLGRVYAAETGFKLHINPDTVRAPDVAFVGRERLRKTPPARGFRAGAPDLAIEVILPNDRHSDVEEKVEDWLEHGARMVVTVNPQTRTATVYRDLENIRRLREGDTLEGADIVPGWELSLKELFTM